MTVHRLGATALIAAALLLTSACSAPTTPVASNPPSPRASSPMPSTAPPTPASTAAAADPTCETIIPDATAADFAGLGWTAQVVPFRLGETTLDEGIECKWGDYSVATDHVQIFGWAPVTDAEADAARDALIAGGWTREDSDEGIYITENADSALAVDDEGYGITYLFGEGWVEIADTKQGLLLVEWPRA